MVVQKIQQSGKSYYLYMPMEWINDNKISKGREVNVNLNHNNIIVNLKSPEERLRIISLQVNSDNASIIAELITHLFVAGYDEFELKFNNSLKKETYAKLRELIKGLGLNMIDLSDKSAKFYVNLSVNDIKKFSRDLIYKALNFTRMLLLNEGSELIDEFIASFQYGILIVLRCLTKFHLGQIQFDIKPYEGRFYYTLGTSLRLLLVHLKKIKDKEFLNNIKTLLEKVLVLYDAPQLDGLIELKEMILDLETKKVACDEDYHKARVRRALKEINYPMTINYLVGLEN